MAAGEEVGQFPKSYVTYSALFHIAVEMYVTVKKYIIFLHTWMYDYKFVFLHYFRRFDRNFPHDFPNILALTSCLSVHSGSRDLIRLV